MAKIKSNVPYTILGLVFCYIIIAIYANRYQLGLSQNKYELLQVNDDTALFVCYNKKGHDTIIYTRWKAPNYAKY